MPPYECGLFESGFLYGDNTQYISWSTSHRIIEYDFTQKDHLFQGVRWRN